MCVCVSEWLCLCVLRRLQIVGKFVSCYCCCSRSLLSTCAWCLFLHVLNTKNYVVHPFTCMCVYVWTTQVVVFAGKLYTDCWKVDCFQDSKQHTHTPDVVGDVCMWCLSFYKQIILIARTFYEWIELLKKNNYNYIVCMYISTGNKQKKSPPSMSKSHSNATSLRGPTTSRYYNQTTATTTTISAAAQQPQK